VKIIIDLDPKLHRMLEALAGARGRTTPELIADLLNRMVNRDASASSSSAEGIPSPAMVEAAKAAKAAASAAATAAAATPATPATPAASWDDVVFLLEPLVARFAETDSDGTQRRALLTELQMLTPDPAVKRLTELLNQSLG
jgi:hypothetical protein